MANVLNKYKQERLTVQVVNRRTHDFDDYIGRGSKWGNPFIIGHDGNREEVCEKYYDSLISSPHLLDALPELVGKTLGCYCAPKLCHGDMIIRVMKERGLIP